MPASTATEVGAMATAVATDVGATNTPTAMMAGVTAGAGEVVNAMADINAPVAAFSQLRSGSWRTDGSGCRPRCQCGGARLGRGRQQGSLQRRCDSAWLLAS